MKTNAKVLVFVLCLMLFLPAASLRAQEHREDWEPVSGKLMTRWAREVSPDNVWPEYPRPTMARVRRLNPNDL